MRSILIVEDEPVLRETYELILSTEPYTIHTATNGAQALKLCQANNYDLVLLDLMMPVMDGVGFLENYSKSGHELPRVIILSNLSAGNELAKSLQLGATKNFVKADLSPKQLITMVRYELQS